MDISLSTAHSDLFTANKPTDISSVWKNATSAERDGYLSFLLHEWSKKPEKIEVQLPFLPFVDWNAQRKGVLTLWMEMFIAPRCAFDLSNKQGKTAWNAWWQHRKSQVDTAHQSFAPLNALQPVGNVRERSPSIQRSMTLMNMLPNRLNGAYDSSIINTLGAAVIAIAQRHDTAVPSEWNALNGLLAEALAPFVLQRTDVDDEVALWWHKQGAVVHPSCMRLPLTQNEIGLVGRPEYIFSYLIKDVAMQAFAKRRVEVDPKRWECLENGFWAACKERWDLLGNNAQKHDFFLPSIPKMLEFTYKELNKACPADIALEYTSKIEKLALLAATGAWPWQKEEQTAPKRRKM